MARFRQWPGMPQLAARIEEKVAEGTINRGGHLGANEPIVAIESPECGSELNNFTVFLANRHSSLGKWMPVSANIA